MTFEELLAEFRDLGGLAHNIVLREGSYGRGVFPEDPTLPILIQIPESLLMPVSKLALRNGDLIVREDAEVPERVRSFFERYQKNFSWGAGVSSQLWETESAWSQLPDAVKHKLCAMLPLEIDEKIFAAPSLIGLLLRYCITRCTHYSSETFGSEACVMPIIELINHSMDGSEYKIRNGVLFDGKYDGEVFAHYNKLFDSLKILITYRFAAPMKIAHSLPVRIINGGKFIQVLRNTGEYSIHNGIRLPKVTIVEEGVNLSYLTLGDTERPRMCRSIFSHLMKDTPIRNPDEVFDQIQAYNRNQYIELLRLLIGHQGAMISELSSGALHQLAALSTYWGSDPIEDRG
ncbi:MAG: hypothetical protein WCO00_11980 [Rhodospirillaceae bacterium]